MICPSWNFRGLGNPCTMRVLDFLILEKFSKLVFIMETRNNYSRMDSVKRRIAMENCFTIHSLGLSDDGLALLWPADVDLTILSYSNWHITAQIQGIDNIFECYFIGFYGHFEASKRHNSWDLLRLLKLANDEALFCVGEFNEITCQSKKWGANPWPLWQIYTFQEALTKCQLSNISTYGQKFT